MCIENHSEAWRSIAKRIYIIRWNLDKTFFQAESRADSRSFSESVAALNLFAKAFASVSACDNPNVTRIVPQRWWRTCGYVSRLQNVSNIFKSTVIHDILRSTIPRQKHPAGPETVLVKIEFYKKNVFSLSEATIVVTWKVGNLDVQIWAFFGQMVFSLQ